MEHATVRQSPSVLRRSRPICVAAALCVLLTACSDPPRPRTFAEFMDDAIARDGTLARCNGEPDGALQDLECANARRAATTIALRQERERRETLERESQRKIDELKQTMLDHERIAREAALAAARAEREAYEALWRQRGGPPEPVYGPVQAPAPPGDGLSLIEIPPNLGTP